LATPGVEVVGETTGGAMTTHGTDTGPITLINVFEIPPEKLEPFLAEWRDRATFMSKQPGFRSFRLHHALSPDSRFQMVNVAEWESADALNAATAQPTFRESVRRTLDEHGVTAHPGVYRVAFEVTAR
jgi:heme oxygenase (mycobilin-producing)